MLPDYRPGGFLNIFFKPAVLGKFMVSEKKNILKKSTLIGQWVFKKSTNVCLTVPEKNILINRIMKKSRHIGLMICA